MNSIKELKCPRVHRLEIKDLLKVLRAKKVVEKIKVAAQRKKRKNKWLTLIMTLTRLPSKKMKSK